jgi:hypothetical protein
MSEQTIRPDFNRETGTLLLRLRKDEVGLGEQPVTYQGKHFQPKDEVHITVVGSALGEELREALDVAGRASTFANLVAATDWRYTLLDGWHHVVRRGDEPAESIIRMVEVPTLPIFYAQLEVLAGLSIPPRPAHITLYTWRDDGGIGIATWEEFAELVVGPINPALFSQAGGT